MRLLVLLWLLTASGLYAQKNRLDVTSIAPGYWVHTTYGEFKGSYVPSNGLIVETASSVWLIDTGWGEKPTRKLLRWIKKHLHKPVQGVVVTHAHDDRAGGIPVLQARKIPLYMTAQTAAILQKQNRKLPPYEALTGESGALPQHAGQWYYPGAGHTPDNIVVYFDRTKVLFGGCFIKSAEAQNLGNLSDANVKEWPAALQRVQTHFPNARIVVPGHLAWGGPELLEHTLHLLETAPK